MESAERLTLVQQIARNAYRVLGLPADASRRRVSDRAAALQRAAKVEIRLQSPWNLEWYGPLQQDQSSITHALGRLSNPHQRLRERLFWMAQSERFVEDISLQTLDSSIAALRFSLLPADHHDAAVLALISCFLMDIDVQDVERWKTTLQIWVQVVESDDFWTEFLDLEASSDFEPAPSCENFDQLRTNSLRLVLEPIAELARDAASRSEFGRCQRALGIIHAAAFPVEIVSAVAESVLCPYEDAISRISKEIKKRCWEDIRQDRESELWNEKTCSVAVERWKQELAPRYSDFVKMAGSNTEAGVRTRQENAEFLTSLGNALTWANEWAEAERFLIDARSCIPAESPTRERIEATLRSIATPAAQQQFEAEFGVGRKSQNGNPRERAEAPRAGGTTAPENLASLCVEINVECWKEIRCWKKIRNRFEGMRLGSIEANRRSLEACERSYQRYEKEVLPWLSIICATDSQTGSDATRAKAAAARCLLSIANAFRRLGDCGTALSLVLSASELANEDSKLVMKIDRLLSQMEMQDRPISEPPTTSASTTPSPASNNQKSEPPSTHRTADQGSAAPDSSGNQSSGGNAFVQLCQTIESKCWQQIQAGHREANLLVFQSAYDDYKRRAAPWLVIVMDSHDHSTTQALRNAAAKCLSSLAGGFISVNDFYGAKTAAVEALRLTNDNHELEAEIKRQLNYVTSARERLVQQLGHTVRKGRSFATKKGAAAAQPQRTTHSAFEKLYPVIRSISVVMLTALLLLGITFRYWHSSLAIPEVGKSADSVNPLAVQQVLEPAIPGSALEPIPVPGLEAIPTPTPIPVPVHDVIPAPVPEPHERVSLPNDTNLITPRSVGGLGSLTISNHTDRDAVVKLKTAVSGSTLRFVYMQAISDVTVPKIPAGTYKLQFATGRDWDETSQTFREDRTFSMFDKPLSFSEDRVADGTEYSVLKITLHPVPNGNAGTEKISAEEFANDSGAGGQRDAGR